jgi:uncharacterized protein (TIGR02246 family)
MTEDERAIRELVDTWMVASKAGDVSKVLSLMSDDAIFMVPGQKPFGKDAFAAVSKPQSNFTIDGRSDIQEIQVLGDWAYMRNHLTVTMTPRDGGKPIRRSGVHADDPAQAALRQLGACARREPDGAGGLTGPAGKLAQGEPQAFRIFSSARGRALHRSDR